MDMDLIRKIVLLLEESPNGFTPGNPKIEGYTDEQVADHAHILIQEGLAEGQSFYTFDSASPVVVLNNLTWKGHKFANEVRDDSIWKKAKKKIQDKVGAVPLGVLTQVLGSFIEKAVGL
ncbi:DUF2513 domain-containing protein [Limnospira fusiformis]|uniref:DUF2513 domain-containing protein n=1 Tax=Limnospira fusiformis TaxID=54297 RepID=UPI0034E0B9B4